MNNSHFVRELRVADEKRFNLSRLAELLSSFREAANQAVINKYVDNPLPFNDPVRRNFGLLAPLDLGTKEVANTRILAWLMNPNASPSHGFGDAILKEILEWCTVNSTPKLEPSRYTTTHDLVVRAEYPFNIPTILGKKKRSGCKTSGRVDVFLQASAPKIRDAWIMVIEAKIDSPESKDQCAAYDLWLEKKFGRTKIFRIFLSPDGREPVSTESRDKWLSMSYLKLAHILRRVWASKVSSSSASEGVDYLSLYINSVLFDIVGYQREDFASGTYNTFAVLDYLDN